MDRFASVQENGMRLRLAMERNPMPADQWTTVSTEVTNVGREPLVWTSDGCETPGYVWGVMDDVTWRPGVEQQDVARRFKDRALGLAFRNDPSLHPRLRFVPRDEIGSGTRGCADLAVPHMVLPGQVLRTEMVWDGHANLRWGPPPSGSVTLTGFFQSFGREGDDRRLELELEHDAWIVGGVDASWLSPPEIVDAALADADFLAYVIEQDRGCKCGLGNGREEILWYRPELGAWEVGLLIWHDFPEPRMQLVLVHPVTGAILDRVDRPWHQERDGFP